MEELMCLSVSLLGGFQMRRRVEGQEYILSEQDSTSRRLWSFLEYMSVFHQRAVSQDELIDVLWGDGDCANPGNTLKTLLHRARSAMERLGFPDGKEVLLYRRGLYTWGPAVTMELDTQRFDALCDLAPADNPDLALEAIALYQGDFLPNAAGGPWAVSLRTYYHTRYLKLCTDTAETLLTRSRYEEAARVCRAATAVDPYDETSHLQLMRALVALGAQQSAIQHYTSVTNMFMDQLGISPSEEMTQFYRELTKAGTELEMDLRTVRDGLLEKRPGAGAFYCEYITFQDIYRLEARSALRSGQVVQLAMLTVLDRAGGKLESQHGSAAMEELRGIIQRCLRVGDTFARFSPAQFLILLPTASYENGHKVFRRILDIYEKTFVGRSTSVKYSLLPVLPMGEEDAGPAHFSPMEHI